MNYKDYLDKVGHFSTGFLIGYFIIISFQESITLTFTSFSLNNVQATLRARATGLDERELNRALAILYNARVCSEPARCARAPQQHNRSRSRRAGGIPDIIKSFLKNLSRNHHC